MIRIFNGKKPVIADSAFVSEAAYVVGDVEIGENSSVWPGAVVRADFGKIQIGRNTAVEDNCVIHSGSLSAANGRQDVVIGDNVIIGHGAVTNCHKIGSNVLIGMNSIILHDVEIGDFCVIAAGSLVRQGMNIPDGSFVAGVPGEIKGKASAEQLLWTQGNPEVYPRLARQYKEQGL
ncbi:MAG: gamma carbonic anhydrase family protein [Chloroflexota bacterium]|nr:gamma carbonic anhydrase family protein [Chloroflexota bacterium]